VTAPAPSLAATLGLARLDYHVRVTSTMDVAHALAEAGAPAGTLVLASAQAAGRGRTGKTWVSEPDAGLWCTLVERPLDTGALDVLALRVGLELASALDPLTEGRVELKWPNDLQVARRKLAGVLIEVRWRGARPDWVAIGVGINRHVPADIPDATSVRADVTRDTLLCAVAPALRRAAAESGPLTLEELSAWERRDVAAGRRVSAPTTGLVAGITASGGIRIRRDDGVEQVCQSGSLIFA
jgi:BirA family transcriptional regulator, biotin operon repressor / biotin---[acetyl-CoA-carboxylase] ligase